MAAIFIAGHTLENRGHARSYELNHRCAIRRSD